MNPESARGSRTSSPTKSNSSRPTSTSSAQQASTPSSPVEGQVTRSLSAGNLTIREQGKSSGGKGKNFVKKNRKSVRSFYKGTGVPFVTAEASNKYATYSREQRNQITPRLIGDDLGTPSNKGSSFFLTSGHHGIREPHKRVTAKKGQNSDS